jgi:hypothetical protein
VPGNNPVDETFNYVIKDFDGDTDNANLVVTVTPNTPPDAASDQVRTNHLTETFAIPFSVLMANDTHPNATITGVTSAVGGTVALDLVNQAVLFTPTAFALPSGSFTYILENGDGGVDAATVTITGVNAQQVNATAPGQILIGNDYALYFSITGDDQSFSGQTDADNEEIFKWKSSVSEYYGGGELTDPGEDIDAFRCPFGGSLPSWGRQGIQQRETNERQRGYLPHCSALGPVIQSPGRGQHMGTNNLNSLFSSQRQS